MGSILRIKTPEERLAGVQQLIDRVMPLLTGETTRSHSMTDGRGKYIKAMRDVVYRIRLTKKKQGDTINNKTFGLFMNSYLGSILPD